MAGKPKQYQPVIVDESDPRCRPIVEKAVSQMQIQMIRQFFVSCTPEEQQAIIAHYY